MTCLLLCCYTWHYVNKYGWFCLRAIGLWQLFCETYYVYMLPSCPHIFSKSVLDFEHLWSPVTVRHTQLSTVGDRAFPVASTRHVCTLCLFSDDAFTFLSLTRYCNFCNACPVVIFGHFNCSFYLLTYSVVSFRQLQNLACHAVMPASIFVELLDPGGVVPATISSPFCACLDAVFGWVAGSEFDSWSGVWHSGNMSEEAYLVYC